MRVDWIGDADLDIILCIPLQRVIRLSINVLLWRRFTNRKQSMFPGGCRRLICRAQRSKILQDQMEARRLKSKAARERRQNRILEKRNALGEDDPVVPEEKK